MLRKLLFALTHLICFQRFLAAQPPVLDWANSMSGSAFADYGRSVAVDANGNVYTIGYFSSTVDFDPSAGGTFNLTTSTTDAFVQKVGPAGNFIWAKQIGGNSNTYGYDIAIDNTTGNLYITGWFSGTTDFNPDPVIVYNQTAVAGTNDAFVEKMDPGGNMLWVKVMGGAANDHGNSIEVDASGNVYTMGYFHGDANFDPGVTNFILYNVGYKDTFIQKRDASGNLIWAKNISGTNDVGGQALTQGNRIIINISCLTKISYNALVHRIKAGFLCKNEKSHRLF